MGSAGRDAGYDLAASCRSEVGTTEVRDEQVLARLSTEPPPDDLVKTIGADEVLEVAEKVADLYRPATASHHQADITILPNWDEPNWVRWVTCHEMGHFVGGFPFKGSYRKVSNIDELGTPPRRKERPTTFSSKDCLCRVWDDDPNNAAFRDLVPPDYPDTCDCMGIPERGRCEGTGP